MFCSDSCEWQTATASPAYTHTHTHTHTHTAMCDDVLGEHSRIKQSDLEDSSTARMELTLQGENFLLLGCEPSVAL